MRESEFFVASNSSNKSILQFNYKRQQTIGNWNKIEQFVRGVHGEHTYWIIELNMFNFIKLLRYTKVCQDKREFVHACCNTSEMWDDTLRYLQLICIIEFRLYKSQYGSQYTHAHTSFEHRAQFRCMHNMQNTHLPSHFASIIHTARHGIVLIPTKCMHNIRAYYNIKNMA